MVVCPPAMNSLADRAIALFRVTRADGEPASPSSALAGREVVVQEHFLVPLNSVMGRGSLLPAHEQQLVRGPTSFGERFHEKQQDYFDQEVSRRHCTIELDPYHRVRVRDLASTNGTWLSRSGPRATTRRQWDALLPGRSYLLRAGYGLRLGANSVHEYTYLGLSYDAHVRLRLCGHEMLDLVDMERWEWHPISLQDSPWSTLDGLGSTQGPLHEGPHFRISVNAAPNRALQAHIEYDTPGCGPRHFVQTSSSRMYGADLENGVTPDLNGQPEDFRAVYELMLPGADEESTSRSLSRAFLEVRRLRMQTQLDPQGWPRTVCIQFEPGPLHKHRASQVMLHFRATKSSRPGAGNHSQRSLRHALVRALLAKRLEDQAQGRLQGAEGWVGIQSILELSDEGRTQPERVRSSIHRWKNELQAKIRQAAEETQRAHPLTVSIGEEESWDFLEECEHLGQSRFRLVPGLRVCQLG